LLVGAWAQPFAERHHFSTNLNDLSDKPTQCKKQMHLYEMQPDKGVKGSKLLMQAYKLCPWPHPSSSNGWLLAEHRPSQCQGTNPILSTSEPNPLDPTSVFNQLGPKTVLSSDEDDVIET